MAENLHKSYINIDIKIMNKNENENLRDTVTKAEKKSKKVKHQYDKYGTYNSLQRFPLLISQAGL
jgi:hypothetical protein